VLGSQGRNIVYWRHTYQLKVHARLLRIDLRKRNHNETVNMQHTCSLHEKENWGVADFSSRTVREEEHTVFLIDHCIRTMCLHLPMPQKQKRQSDHITM
jgi:hypothetical protein